MRAQAPPVAPQQVNGHAPAQPQRRAQGLSILVHAPSKSGKSTLADSGPQPRLIEDIEGASYWTPSRKAYWDPMRQQVPQPPGRRLTAGYGAASQTPEWESCIALIREAREIDQVYRVLKTGQHPFNSLSIDSVTEMQQRVIDQEAPGTGKVERDVWNTLLRKITTMVRAHRDLINNPVRPLWSVTFVAGTSFFNGKWRPMVQGQSRDHLPYYVDLLGYLHANMDQTRDLLIGPHPEYETGERVGGRLPYALRMGYPGRVQGWTVEDMLKQVLRS